MERKNERGPDDVFTAMLCPKCKEFYEADRKHVCRRRNSYPMQITEDRLTHVDKVTEPDRTLNIFLDTDHILRLLRRGRILIGPNHINREDEFNAQFITIHLEDYKK